MDVNSILAYDMPVAYAPPDNTEVYARPAETETAKPASNVISVNWDAADKHNGARSMSSLEKAIEQVNKSLVNFNREMHISVHPKVNRIMVKVIDTEEHKVIREIPPEKMLDAFAKALELAGVLIDERR